MQSNLISIVIPIYNEEKYIESCINSILNSDYPKEFIEVLLVDGGSNDKTLDIIKEYQKKYSFFKLFHNSAKIAPVAMNIGVKHSSGEYIFIISAHAQYSSQYFSKLVHSAIQLNADCVGPILETRVKNSTIDSNAIAKVLSNKYGVGSSFRSVKIEEPLEVDTVPFGCYKRKVFEKYGLYNEKLVRNQDIELNKRIVKGGGKIYLIPDVKCVYFARENFKELAKNNFNNGLWNILTAYYTNSFDSLSLRHFIPLFFVLSIIFPLFFSFIDLSFLYISIIVLLSHFILVYIQSLKMLDRTTTVKKLLKAFYTLHLSYGLGSLVGIFLVIKQYVSKVKK